MENIESTGINGSTSSTPRPSAPNLEYQGHSLQFKSYLKSHAFSYRCRNHNSCQCKYLLTIPITSENYDLITWECKAAKGAYRASNQDHSNACKSLNSKEPEIKSSQNDDKVTQWGSDIYVLIDFIRNNLRFEPKTIKAHMNLLKQDFKLTKIKEIKKQIIDELYPRDHKIAFDPTNCLIEDAKDKYADNLFRFSARATRVTKTRKVKIPTLGLHEFYIFATRNMLFQLESLDQWFIDGTFAIAPIGFQQLITVIVYIKKYHIYSACFILATDKTEALYQLAFKSLKMIAEQENFILNPKLIMSDFETGLRNALKCSFNISDNETSSNSTKLIGCYFHFVKAIIKKAMKLKLITKTSENRRAKILIGLLKILIHCPVDKKKTFFEEIESNFNICGSKYERFLAYFRKNWLENDFLEPLIKEHLSNEDMAFIRTNNGCELFNKYLGEIFQCRKPRPGFFIDKLKIVEHDFRGKYLEKCQGGGKKKVNKNQKSSQKHNFDRNPLEKFTLPYLDILALCLEETKEKKYNLRELQKNNDFYKNIEKLTCEYINQIEFLHLKTQKDKEIQGNDEILSNNEEKENSDQIDKESSTEEELQEDSLSDNNDDNLFEEKKEVLKDKNQQKNMESLFYLEERGTDQEINIESSYRLFYEN